MKSAGTVPEGAVALADLARVNGDGPYLSVYVPTESAVENAAQKSEAQWKNLRRELEAQGAPESALALVDDLVPDAHLSGETLVVIADAENLLVVEHLREPFVNGRGQWAPTADLVPIIKERQERIPYVIAWIDHGTAEITGHTASGDERHDEAGDGDAQKKNNPGGWSQSRYQRRVEGDWTRNAQDAVHHITQLADEIGARVVLVGGEISARSLVYNEMPTTWADRLVLLDGQDESDIRAAVNTVVANDTVAFLEKFKEELGQHDRATDGVSATLDAINRAAVDVLLVRDNRDERRDTPSEDGAVVDALIRDAMATGASVRVIPAAGPVTDGVGALLRWS